MKYLRCFISLDHRKKIFIWQRHNWECWVEIVNLWWSLHFIVFKQKKIHVRATPAVKGYFNLWGLIKKSSLPNKPWGQTRGRPILTQIPLLNHIVLLALLSCEKKPVNENMIEFYILTEPVKWCLFQEKNDLHFQ